MGTIIGWRCEDCGARRGFALGGGRRSYNNPEVVEQSANGSLGPAMKKLLEEGIPDGWTVLRESAYYNCPKCGEVIGGATIRIDDGSGWWLTYHAKPDACESCGEELFFWPDKVPMSEKELLARCEHYVKNGCPACGGTNVSVDMANWD